MLKKILFFCFCFSSFSVRASEEVDFNFYETSIYSQNGEDGILSKIFSLIGTSSKFCVEFGAYDGITGSNTYLLRRQGWKALLLDRAYEIPEYNLHKAFITADNITQLFDDYNVPYDLDLLSIDIDYNDFYVWHKLDNKYKPKVVVIEYNATHPPDQDKVVKYRPYYCGDGTTYYGASILALYHLARTKGYSLVYADQAGVNLFFVRDEALARGDFHIKNINDVEKIYRKPQPIHREDIKKRSYVSSGEAMESSQ